MAKHGQLSKEEVGPELREGSGWARMVGKDEALLASENDI